MKKQSLFIIILLVLIVLTTIPVNAQTILMSNPDGTAERDIIVYSLNSTEIGVYNTSSLIPLNGEYNYIFVLKPQGNNFIDDPGDWLTNYAFPYVKTNIIPLLLIATVIMIALTRRRS